MDTPNTPCNACGKSTLGDVTLRKAIEAATRKARMRGSRKTALRALEGQGKGSKTNAGTPACTMRANENAASSPMVRPAPKVFNKGGMSGTFASARKQQGEGVKLLSWEEM